MEFIKINEAELPTCKVLAVCADPKSKDYEYVLHGWLKHFKGVLYAFNDCDRLKTPTHYMRESDYTALTSAELINLKFPEND